MERSRQGYVDIELTAWHEAAHAVVALHHRRPVQDIRVSTRLPGDGCTRLGPRMRWPVFEPTPGNIRAVWLQTLAKYQADIRIFLAGPLAEAKLLATPLRSLGARSDLQRAERCHDFLVDAYRYLSRYCALPKPLPADWLACERRYTRRLVARPRHWQAIGAVAAALLRQRQVHAVELTALIQSALDSHRSDRTMGLFMS
ncbi:hypothetical protein J2T55_000201 [Methylohalomonas lacus]|uniref:Peptidase M41 domain-containing protein n=2 Tax=Methylohalomonas lacus TaxID=398773 RepID=A0AAE3HH52_9GAMM|nr:hypothetical protein [Methylohalomonas lacus]